MKNKPIIILILLLCTSPYLQAQDGIHQFEYLKSKENFMEPFSWLPKRVYQSYTFYPIAYEVATKSVTDRVDEKLPGPQAKFLSPAFEIIKQRADYGLLVRLTNYSVIPYDTSGQEEGLPENIDIEEYKKNPEKLKMPLTMQREQAWVIYVPMVSESRKTLQEKGLIEATGEQILDHPVYSGENTSYSGREKAYFVFEEPDVILCAEELFTIRAMLQARYQLRPSMVEDPWIKMVSEHFDEFYPKVGIVDRRNQREQWILQALRQGSTREEAIEQYKQYALYDMPGIMINSSISDEKTIKYFNLMLFPYDNKKKGGFFYANEFEKIQKWRREDPGNEYKWEEGDDFISIAYELNEEELVKDREAIIEQRDKQKQEAEGKDKK